MSFSLTCVADNKILAYARNGCVYFLVPEFVQVQELLY